MQDVPATLKTHPADEGAALTMQPHTLGRIGAAALGAAGLVWCYGSLAGGDSKEALLCGTFSLGFIMVAFGVTASPARRRPLLVAGLVIAAVPSIYWATDAAWRAQLDSPWFVLGAGVALAAVLAVAGVLSGRKLALGTRAAFLVVVGGSILLLADGVGANVWTAASGLTFAGAALLAGDPPTPVES